MRLAYRAHRLMGGQLRIATGPLHQAQLAGMVSLQAMPPRIRLSGANEVGRRFASINFYQERLSLGNTAVSSPRAGAQP